MELALPRRIAILGFARTGRALAEALLARGVEVAVGDDRPEAEFEGLQELERRGVRLFFGGSRERLLDGAGWLALSPGVPTAHALAARAREKGIAVLAELEIAWRIAEAEAEGKNRWVGVSGTNGKSTTTAWIAEILRRAGRDVVLAGNIGVPLAAFLGERRARDFVCEVSSFQLETIERFRPDVAVLTNVTPDHLDRYADFQAYAATKARLLANQLPSDVAVVNADDPICRSVATRARRISFSRRERARGGAWLEADELVSEIGGRHALIAAASLAIPGAHNVENALASLAAAESLGAPPEAVRDGLVRFQGLPHRTELVVEKDGVRWVDDSKGTNVDATRKALEGYRDRSVLLILGGRDKHGDFASLAGGAGRAARVVLTIGEAAGTIERALAGAAPVERCGTMERAVARAETLAQPGDTVLLSPACASFDAYANFEERGRHFAALVRAALARRET
jgi:UDP-N-acetylmuramoylalanine--D-glutamate ligase